jgi:hypothetical protein
LKIGFKENPKPCPGLQGRGNPKPPNRSSKKKEKEKATELTTMVSQGN